MKLPKFCLVKLVLSPSRLNTSWESINGKRREGEHEVKITVLLLQRLLSNLRESADLSCQAEDLFDIEELHFSVTVDR